MLKNNFTFFFDNYLISWAFLSCAYHWHAIGSLIWWAHKVMILIKVHVFMVFVFFCCAMTSSHNTIFMYSDIPVFPATPFLNCRKVLFFFFSNSNSNVWVYYLFLLFVPNPNYLISFVEHKSWMRTWQKGTVYQVFCTHTITLWGAGQNIS